MAHVVLVISHDIVVEFARGKIGKITSTLNLLYLIVLSIPLVYHIRRRLTLYYFDTSRKVCATLRPLRRPTTPRQPNSDTNGSSTRGSHSLRATPEHQTHEPVGATRLRNLPRSRRARLRIELQDLQNRTFTELEVPPRPLPDDIVSMIPSSIELSSTTSIVPAIFSTGSPQTSHISTHDASTNVPKPNLSTSQATLLTAFISEHQYSFQTALFLGICCQGGESTFDYDSTFFCFDLCMTLGGASNSSHGNGGAQKGLGMGDHPSTAFRLSKSACYRVTNPEVSGEELTLAADEFHALSVRKPLYDALNVSIKAQTGVDYLQFVLILFRLDEQVFAWFPFPRFRGVDPYMLMNPNRYASPSPSSMSSYFPTSYPGIGWNGCSASAWTDLTGLPYLEEIQTYYAQGVWDTGLRTFIDAGWVLRAVRDDDDVSLSPSSSSYHALGSSSVKPETLFLGRMKLIRRAAVGERKNGDDGEGGGSGGGDNSGGGGGAGRIEKEWVWERLSFPELLKGGVPECWARDWIIHGVQKR